MYGNIDGFDIILEILKIKALNIIVKEINGTEEIHDILKQIEIYEQQEASRKLVAIQNLNI